MTRGEWTPKQTARLADVQEILTALRDFWPMTLRAIYYQLVKSGNVRNVRAEYSKLSRLLRDARLDGLLPWDAMEDRTRGLLASGGWCDLSAFIESEKRNFLTGFRRDLLRGQEIRPEIWVEKDALAPICHRAAFPFCVHVVAARGFSSTSFINEARERINRSAANGQLTMILFLTDLDPSGLAMLPAVVNTFERMGVNGHVEAERVALTPAQVEAYKLPTNPDALKKTDSRAAKYREQYGELAVELDALPPHDLLALVENSIRGCLDMDLFQAEQAKEESEAAEVEVLRGRLLEMWGAA